MTITIAIAGTAIAILSAVFSYIQAHAARCSLQQAYLLKLFASFDAASESTISNPEFLYAVHGLSRDTPVEEARSIAYLSMLLDAFQHFYGEAYGGDFARMARDMKKESTFLNRILSLPDNQRRWSTLKEMYYGDSDSAFVAAVESLMANTGGTSKPSE